MTRNETIKILAVMTASYPSYKPMNMDTTIATWAEVLAEDDYMEISAALQSYIRNDTSGFAPSIGQLLAHRKSLMGSRYLDREQAWDMYYKAICNSGYNSVSEFAKLPKEVQIAAGSPENLFNLSMDTNFNMEVEKSHFLKSYDTAVKRSEYKDNLPKEMRERVEQIEAQSPSGRFNAYQISRAEKKYLGNS